jgi:hypothetical protein
MIHHSGLKNQVKRVLIYTPNELEVKNYLTGCLRFNGVHFQRVI